MELERKQIIEGYFGQTLREIVLENPMVLKKSIDEKGQTFVLAITEQEKKIFPELCGMQAVIIDLEINFNAGTKQEEIQCNFYPIVKIADEMKEYIIGIED